MFTCSLSVNPQGSCDWKRKAVGHGLVLCSAVSSPLGVSYFKPPPSPHITRKELWEQGSRIYVQPLCQNANVMVCHERAALLADSSGEAYTSGATGGKRGHGSCKMDIRRPRNRWLMWIWCALMARVWSWIRCNVERLISMIKVTALLNHDESSTVISLLMAAATPYCATSSLSFLRYVRIGIISVREEITDRDRHVCRKSTVCTVALRRGRSEVSQCKNLRTGVKIILVLIYCSCLMDLFGRLGEILMQESSLLKIKCMDKFFQILLRH